MEGQHQEDVMSEEQIELEAAESEIGPDQLGEH